jgi:hypothetical protein
MRRQRNSRFDSVPELCSRHRVNGVLARHNLFKASRNSEPLAHQGTRLAFLLISDCTITRPASNAAHAPCVYGRRIRQSPSSTGGHGRFRPRWPACVKVRDLNRPLNQRSLGPYLLYSLPYRGIGSVLRSMLHDPVVFRRSAHDLPAFP